MRLRRRYLPLAVVLGVAVAVLAGARRVFDSKARSERKLRPAELAMLGDPGIEPAGFQRRRLLPAARSRSSITARKRTSRGPAPLPHANRRCR